MIASGFCPLPRSLELGRAGSFFGRLRVILGVLPIPGHRLAQANLEAYSGMVTQFAPGLLDAEIEVEEQKLELGRSQPRCAPGGRGAADLSPQDAHQDPCQPARQSLVRLLAAQ